MLKSNWTNVKKVTPKEGGEPFYICTVTVQVEDKTVKLPAFFSEKLAMLNVPPSQFIDSCKPGTQFRFSGVIHESDKGQKFRIVSVLDTRDAPDPEIKIVWDGDMQFSLVQSGKELFTIKGDGDLTPIEMFETSLFHLKRKDPKRKVIHLISHWAYRHLLREENKGKLEEFLTQYWEACTTLYENAKNAMPENIRALAQFMSYEDIDVSLLAQSQIDSFKGTIQETKKSMPEQKAPAITPSKDVITNTKKYHKDDPKKKPKKNQNKNKKTSPAASKEETEVEIFI